MNNRWRWTRLHLLAGALALVVTGPAPASVGPFVTCTVPVGGSPTALVAEDIDLSANPPSRGTDFNTDGNPDFAFINSANGQVVIGLTNRDLFATGDCLGAVTLSTVQLSSSGAVSLAAGDLDQTGTVDLAVAAQAGVIILKGSGQGTFTQDGSPLVAGVDPQVVVVADVDGDGLNDIVVGDGNGNSVTILYGKSGGGFDASTPIPVDGPVTAVAVSDFDQDSYGDIAAASNLTGEVTVFLQNRLEPRTFRALAPFYVGVAPTALQAGNLNNSDVAPDLAVTSGGTAGTLGVFLSNLPAIESPPFEQTANVPTGAGPSGLQQGKLDEDANADIVVSNADGNTVAMFLGDGSGGMSEVNPGPCTVVEPISDRCQVGSGPSAVALADVDGDGRNDIITSNRNAGSLSVLLSSDPPPTPTWTSTDTPTVTPTVTPTPTPTTTPTVTPTGTPTATDTPTNTPRPTFTPTITFTPSPVCYAGGVCVSGKACSLQPHATDDHSGLWLVLPALLLLAWRRRR
jgi:hypothetical protein